MTRVGWVNGRRSTAIGQRATGNSHRATAIGQQAAGNGQRATGNGQRFVRRREGVALVAALLAVVIIGALVAALVFAANEETKTGAATGSRRRTLLAAESALERELSTSSVESLDSMQLGSASSRATTSSGIPVQVYITRLDSSRFWLVSVAIQGTRNSGAVSRVGLIGRIVRDSAGSRTMVRIPERGWAELF